MILSFGDKETEKIWSGERSSRLPGEIQQLARRKLRLIFAAEELDDLRTPPGNRLKKIGADWDSFYSIRINRQWRIIFNWIGGHATEVSIMDYH